MIELASDLSASGSSKFLADLPAATLTIPLFGFPFRLLEIYFSKLIEVLNYLKIIDCCFLNLWFARRILLTISITDNFVEISFLKLKLIKSYFKSTTSQEIE